MQNLKQGVLSGSPKIQQLFSEFDIEHRLHPKAPFGIHVLKFKIGFGKELFSIKDKQNCSYSFGVLPLGGYVQMLGENNNST